jgi:hypothetical protein
MTNFDLSFYGSYLFLKYIFRSHSKKAISHPYKPRVFPFFCNKTELGIKLWNEIENKRYEHP